VDQQRAVVLRGAVKTGIERSCNSLLLWLVPLMFAQVGAIAALKNSTCRHKTVIFAT
jgi:hypothetical protein